MTRTDIEARNLMRYMGYRLSQSKHEDRMRETSARARSPRIDLEDHVTAPSMNGRSKWRRKPIPNGMKRVRVIKQAGGALRPVARQLGLSVGKLIHQMSLNRQM